MKNKLLFICFFVVSVSSTFSQGALKTNKWRQGEKDSLTKAQMLFEEQNFLMALPIYSQLQKNHPNELYLKYVTGICGLYRSDMHEASLDFLQQVYEKNKKAVDIEYDIARALHYNYKFDEALGMLDLFLKRKNITPEQRKKAEQLQLYCNNAKALVAAPVDATIDNMGAVVNTEGSEYVPVISSDENVLIYTYTGKQSTGGLQNAYNEPDPLGIYYEDVLITKKENGEWAKPQSIGGAINSNANDAAIAISNDGQKLFIYKDNSYDGGDIYISKLDTARWAMPEKLRGAVNTAAWEGSASLSPDENTLYFSSERPGGFGGRDIYSATKNPDGSWGNVRNLGKGINTALNDDAPFFHPDGKTLIFSSEGWNSMGSYDIFRTTYNAADSSWSAPENLGAPINTPDDDRYFVLSADGTKGYYASGKSGGYGLHDIYIVAMPENFLKPALVLVQGNITANKKPVLANIKVLTETKALYAEYASNAQTGNYLFSLPKGHQYSITYNYTDFPEQTANVDAMKVDSFAKRTIDIRFGVTNDSIAKTDSLAKPVDLTQKLGDASMEGLEFRVQIAAYTMSKNYKYDHLKGLGEVEKVKLTDGITRFTIGGIFKTLNEANAHLAKVRAAGQQDAFVTAIYKGKRVYLEELEKLGLLPPQPK